MRTPLHSLFQHEVSAKYSFVPGTYGQLSSGQLVHYVAWRRHGGIFIAPVRLLETGVFSMSAWRFYQGLKSEWRWYVVDTCGEVALASDQAFAELPACMANAESAGFRGISYQVHTRPNELVGCAFGHLPRDVDSEEDWEFPQDARRASHSRCFCPSK